MLSHEDFRRIALGMDGAVESAHMGHPDFRVNGRIFATLHPDLQCGMLKLTPGQQQKFILENPATFRPREGCMGTRGMHQRALGFGGGGHPWRGDDTRVAEHRHQPRCRTAEGQANNQASAQALNRKGQRKAPGQITNHKSL